MKKLATSLLALAAVAAFAIPAHATTLLSEPFSYPDGNLAGNGGWTTHSGSASDISVTGARALATEWNAAFDKDDNTTFAAQSTSVPTYACFQVTIPDPGGSPKPNYFAHLKDASATIFLARLYVLPSGATGFTFGITVSSSSATVLPVPWGSALTYGAQYNVVIKYDPTTSTATLWVNPVNEASTNVSHTNTTTAAAISSFALRQSNSAPTGVTGGSVGWVAYVDNVGVGTTFNDACYQVTPTKSNTWGQLKVIYR
jgi:hypothetical protein